MTREAHPPPEHSPSRGEGARPQSAQANTPSSSVRLPPTAPGLRIGLLGGTFNPPHEAHRAVSLFAMKRLGLDRVWWLVTPGNPLKDTNGLPPVAERMAAAQALVQDNRIEVTDIEARIGTRYTADTLTFLVRRRPQVRFVWLMGADGLRDFHRWQNWRRILGLVPVAVIDRGGIRGNPLASPAAHAFSRYRLPEAHAARLADCAPPAWCFLHGLKMPLSSTLLRGANVANVSHSAR